MTTKEYFQKLQILYFVFLSSILPLVGIAVFYNDFIDIQLDKSLIVFINYVPLVFGVSTVVLAIIVFKFLTGRIKKESTLNKKLVAYHHAFILRSTLIEGMLLLNVVAYAITTNTNLLIFSTLLFGLLFVLKPSKKEVKNTFDLSPTDLMKIDDDSQKVITREELTGRNRMA